ncbi:unnamed protein product [Aphanomyces euteiches]
MNACYDETGEVCPVRTRKLARFYVDKGIAGLYIGGSTGEGIVQNVQERKIVLEAVAQEVGKELTLIAHVGAPSTKDSVELAKNAEQMGFHAISAVPSIYYPLSETAVEYHWQQIIDSTSLPFIMYHIPLTTGFHLTPRLLSKMSKQDKVAGVKITTMNSYELQQFKVLGGEDFMVFNGPDEQYLAGKIMGATGGIGGSYGTMPELFVKIDQCFNDNQIEAAQKWQFKVNEIITDLLSLSSFYGACKEVIKLRGVEIGEPRRPIPSLVPEDLPKAVEIYNKIMACIQESKE